MTDNSSIRTLQGLFKNRRNIQIPVYQRAYSWDKKQCKQFFDDLVEQSGNSYHLGLFIFEHTDDTFFIIDGQQRLTTAVLFFAALAKTKIAHHQGDSEIKERYLSGGFSTVDIDNKYFSQLIKEFSCGDMKAETLSQRKIKDAFDFFVSKLEKIYQKGDLGKADNLQKSLESAKIGIFDIEDKGEASQVFEYQNNRGVHASNFEIVKAYLIHQIYVNSSNSDTEISEIQDNISRIYRNLEEISEHFDEDDILLCWFYLYEYYQNINHNIGNI
jgi:uncharacterized protein with ParB-like and HNH nuclease domain